MSNDLISRSAFKELLISYGCLDAAALLDDLLTAYDVDKVVERLKGYQDCYESKAAKYDECGDIENMVLSDAAANAYREAIEIVKAGGVSDNH